MRTCRTIAMMLAVGLLPGSKLFGWTLAGDVVSNSIGSNSVEFHLSSGAIARVELLDPGILRVRVNPAGSLSDRVSPAIAPQGLLPPNASILESNGVVWLVTSRMQVAVIQAPFQVVALNADGSPITADASAAVFWDDLTGEIVARKLCPSDEHFFGLGERGGPIDRRGRSLVMRNTDNSSYGEFTDPLYQSYPFYYGLREGKAYGIFLDNPAFPFFDMDGEGLGQVLFGAQRGELNYYVLAGPTPFEVASSYARLTGCNPLPPKWSLGYHHSRYGWTNSQQILDIAGQLRSRDFPCDSLWFDIDYLDQGHQFTWNPASFPDLIGMNQELAGLNFHRVFINEPCLLRTDPLWPYMAASGYLVQDSSGDSFVGSIWFGEVSFVDFSRGVARDWYKEQLKTFLSVGISGLWLDLNEPANNFMPDAVYDFDGDQRSDLESRDLYALLEARTAYEAELELRTNTRPWNCSRSGYSGIQRYSATWGGDAQSTFDSLRVSIQMSISMGLSGQNQFGHDTGGFLGSPSGELFTRWLEFSCFTPLFRNHSINTSPSREPWSFGEPYTDLIRQVIQQRYRWLPYTYTLFEEASRTGRPVLAPTFFYAAGDSNTYTQDTEYLFGPDLLVAPVFVDGATNRTLYLPAASDWTDIWTDRQYPGGQVITVPAPLGTIPLLVRAGAILVRGAVMPYVNASGDPDLNVDVYPQGGSAFTLYEDDGASFDYKSGVFLRTEIQSQWNLTAGKVFISRVAGSFQPPKRSWALTIHHVPASPMGVELNGTPLPLATNRTELDALTAGWFYDAVLHEIVSKFADDAGFLELNVMAPPSFVTAPIFQTAPIGSCTTFSAVAGGSMTMYYQWFLNGTNILIGQTNASLVLTNIQPVNAGDYSVVITNNQGSVTGLVAALSVVLDKIGLTVDAGGAAHLTFVAAPDLEYAIQYRSNLTDASWLFLTNFPAESAARIVEHLDPGSQSTATRFYRIMTPVPMKLQQATNRGEASRTAVNDHIR